MKMSKAEKANRKLIAELEADIAAETQQLIGLRNEVQATERLLAWKRDMAMRLRMNMEPEPPANPEAPQPKRRGRKPKEQKPAEKPPEGDGRPLPWFHCENPICGEKFTRPAVVQGIQVCPHCDSPQFRRVEKEP